MSRPQDHAKLVAALKRATTETTDARTSHEVQGTITATRIMVQSLGMPRARSARFHPVVEQDQKRATEAGPDKNSLETGAGNELGSVAPAGERRPDGIAYERIGRAMGKPIGLELAIRRELQSLPWSRRSLVCTLMMQRLSSVSVLIDDNMDF